MWKMEKKMWTENPFNGNKVLIKPNFKQKEKCLPLHCWKGFPENPGLHIQLNVPGLFEQTAFSPHRPLGPLDSSHSFISGHSRIIRNIIISNFLDQYIVCKRANYNVPIHPAAMSLGLKVHPSSQIQ